MRSFTPGRREVPDVGIPLENAGNHPYESKLADKRIIDALKDDADRVGVFADLALGAVDGHVAERSREKLDDRIHQFGDADIFDRAAREYRNRMAELDRLLEAREHLLVAELFAVEVAHHQFVVGFGDRVEPQPAAFGDVVGDFRRNIPVEKHVHHAVERVARTDRPVKGMSPICRGCRASLRESP